MSAPPYGSKQGICLEKRAIPLAGSPPPSPFPRSRCRLGADAHLQQKQFRSRCSLLTCRDGVTMACACRKNAAERGAPLGAAPPQSETCTGRVSALPRTTPSTSAVLSEASQPRAGPIHALGAGNRPFSTPETLHRQYLGPQCVFQHAHTTAQLPAPPPTSRSSLGPIRPPPANFTFSPGVCTLKIFPLKIFTRRPTGGSSKKKIKVMRHAPSEAGL